MREYLTEKQIDKLPISKYKRNTDADDSRYLRRFRMILLLLKEGLEYKEIETETGIPHRTIEFIVLKMGDILGGRNKTQTVVIAIQMKIIDINEIPMKTRYIKKGTAWSLSKN